MTATDQPYPILIVAADQNLRQLKKDTREIARKIRRLGAEITPYLPYLDPEDVDAAFSEVINVTRDMMMEMFAGKDDDDK
jgi:hypothetical protein